MGITNSDSGTRIDEIADGIQITVQLTEQQQAHDWEGPG